MNGWLSWSRRIPWLGEQADNCGFSRSSLRVDLILNCHGDELTDFQILARDRSRAGANSCFFIDHECLGQNEVVRMDLLNLSFQVAREETRRGIATDSL